MTARLVLAVNIAALGIVSRAGTTPGLRLGLVVLAVGLILVTFVHDLLAVAERRRLEAAGRRIRRLEAELVVVRHREHEAAQQARTLRQRADDLSWQLAVRDIGELP